MSATTMGRFELPRVGVSLRLRQAWASLSLPLEAWSARRRRVVASIVAVAVFGLGMQGWMAADVDGRDSSRAALVDAQRRLSDARHAIAQLPAMRADAAARGRHALPAVWTSADDVRALSRLAGQSGLDPVALEPGATSGAGKDEMRPVLFGAQGDFARMLKFVDGLTTLPVLVVPSEMEIVGDGGMLSMSATLQVFSRLPPAGSAESNADAAHDAIDENPDVVFYDPFAQHPLDAGAAMDEALRLVGLMRDRVHALALVETADGAIPAAPGEPLGEGRVTRIDAHGVTLTTSAGERQLTLMEDAP